VRVSSRSIELSASLRATGTARGERSHTDSRIGFRASRLGGTSSELPMGQVRFSGSSTISINCRSASVPVSVARCSMSRIDPSSVGVPSANSRVWSRLSM